MGGVCNTLPIIFIFTHYALRSGFLSCQNCSFESAGFQKTVVEGRSLTCFPSTGKSFPFLMSLRNFRACLKYCPVSFTTKNGLDYILYSFWLNLNQTIDGCVQRVEWHVWKIEAVSHFDLLSLEGRTWMSTQPVLSRCCSDPYPERLYPSIWQTLVKSPAQNLSLLDTFGG